MTKRVVSRVPQIFRDAQVYIHQRIMAKSSDSAFETAKKPVRKWLKENGETDENGNIVYIFPRPVNGIDDKVYTGVELRCAPGVPYFDAEEVRDFMQGYEGKVRKRVLKMIEVVDFDALYVLHQEGEITEEELRGLLHDKEPSYSLWPIEGKEVLEED